MNFLMRSSQSTAPEVATTPDPNKETNVGSDGSHSLHVPSSDFSEVKSSLDDNGKELGGEGLISGSVVNGGSGSEVSRAKTRMVIEDHVDVGPEEGGVLIPSKKLPEEWNDVLDLSFIRSIDRNFVFPGEQLHILVYISCNDVETKEIITPFKVAAVMSKSGYINQASANGKASMESHLDSFDEFTNSFDKDKGTGVKKNRNEFPSKIPFQKGNDVVVGESLLKMEGHKKRISILLESLRNSHFFVRIASANEPLWSKRNAGIHVADSVACSDGGVASERPEMLKVTEFCKSSAAVIEEGEFDPNLAGGVARNVVACCSLSNGDVMVILEVTVAAVTIKDAMLEVLQFEKFESISSNPALQRDDRFFQPLKDAQHCSVDPCKELLQWLLPLDRPLHPVVPSLSPLSLSSNSFTASSPQRPPVPGTSSTLFSFGNLRSYSSNSLASTSPVPTSSSNNLGNNLNLEDWNNLTAHKTSKTHEVGSEGLLSFRGASLEPQRFSVHCGLEGLYVPGKRWRKNLQIIQPIEVESYFADCNTEDLVCVLIKNVMPVDFPDVVFYVDSISMICDIAATGTSPVSVPICSIEAGNNHLLPGLALRRGEQHSFILKPKASVYKCLGSDNQNKNEFAVLVSCQCSHTESRLFFKHATEWQPRKPSELLISVESEIGKPAIGSDGSVSQLSPQVLTLQATNLTENDVNLTLLAPASMASPHCVVSMSPLASTPHMQLQLLSNDGDGTGISPFKQSCSASLLSIRPLRDASETLSSSLKDQNISAADFMADSNPACDHLWLQSTVPLGCVPSLSTKTVKLELLPLTDGIITLDTLQIANKDKGVVYVPEKSLKIYSTSSIASGIM